MHGETTTITCLQCGTSFSMSRSIAEKRGRKFCTPRCAGEHRREATRARWPELQCLQCGKKFRRWVGPSQAPPMYCSAACNGASRVGGNRSSARPGRELTCPSCSVVFTTRSPSRVYCSRACQLKVAHEARRNPKIRDRPCEKCGKTFRPKQGSAAGRFCSRECLYAGNRREKSANWRGGRYEKSDGYVKVYQPDHPGADGMGYVLEHRFVMEQELGRLLRPGETVHHKNGVRGDNRPENLQLRQGNHGKGARYVCLDCGSHNVGNAPI